MWKFISDVLITLHVCQLRLKFDYSNFNIKVKWHKELVDCGLILVHLENRSYMLVEEAKFPAHYSLALVDFFVINLGSCNYHNRSFFSNIAILSNTSMTRWVATCKLMFSSFMCWVMSVQYAVACSVMIQICCSILNTGLWLPGGCIHVEIIR
jgi:hypothetical protein